MVHYSSVRECNPHKSIRFVVQSHGITCVPAFEYRLSINLRQFNVTERYSPIINNGK